MQEIDQQSSLHYSFPYHSHSAEAASLKGMVATEEGEANGLEDQEAQPEAAAAAPRSSPAPARLPDLVSLPALQTWTKLRPGVRRFLAEARGLFELHVYTMGDRAYARAMGGILDPDGRLFAGRIISAVRRGVQIFISEWSAMELLSLYSRQATN